MRSDVDITVMEKTRKKNYLQIRQKQKKEEEGKTNRPISVLCRILFTRTSIQREIHTHRTHTNLPAINEIDFNHHRIVKLKKKKINETAAKKHTHVRRDVMYRFTRLSAAMPISHLNMWPKMCTYVAENVLWLR